MREARIIINGRELDALETRALHMAINALMLNLRPSDVDSTNDGTWLKLMSALSKVHALLEEAPPPCPH